MAQIKLNHSLTYKKVILYRKINKKIRYYSLELIPTLFGDILFIRKYGGLKNKRPTRIIKKYFSDIDCSLRAFEYLIGLKQKKGYYSNA